MAREFYSEQQRFNQIFIWIVIGLGAIPLGGTLLWGIYQQLILGQPWGDTPMSDLGLVLISIISFAIIIGIVLLFRFAKLEIKVDRWAVQYKFSPLIDRWKEIQKAEIKEYNIIKYSFRGYGVRWGLDGIKTINVKGNMGIQFLYADNKKIILGTQQPELFLAALNKMMEPEED